MNYGELPIDDLLAKLDLQYARRIWRDAAARAAREGWQPQEFLAVLLVQEVNHQRVKRLHKLAEQARLPFFKTLKDFKFQRVARCCEAVLSQCSKAEAIEQGRSLLLIGGPGKGKTHLAIAIAYQALQEGRSVLYTRADELQRELAQGIASEQWREVLDRYVKPDILVVDGLEKIAATSGGLFLMLNERYAAHKMVLLTSRTTPDRWSNRHDAAMVTSLLRHVLERGQILFLEEPGGGEAEIELKEADLSPELPAPVLLSLIDDRPHDREPAPDERRSHVRYRACFEVNASSPHNFFAGFCQDISEAGIFIATYASCEIGEVLELEFKIPSGRQIRTEGVIRWKQTQATEAGEQPGVGVEFLALKQDDQIAIREFFAQREPFFHA